MPKYYSTKELAKMVGISRQTLSAIINNTWKKRRISEETFKRVTDAINEIGFVPDKSAIALRKADHSLIGLIYYGKLHSHILQAIQQTNNFFQETQQSVKIVLSRKHELKSAIEGLFGDRIQRLVIILTISGPDFARELEGRKIQQLLKIIPSVIYNFPFDIHDISLEQNLSKAKVALVGFSRVSVYRKLLTIVHKLHIKRILIEQCTLEYLQKNREIRVILSSFDLVKSFQVPTASTKGSNEFLIGEDVAADLISSLEHNKIKLVITDCDMVAQGFCSTLTTRGYKIPNEIGVVGFDDINAVPYFKIPLTTIQVPVKPMVKNLLHLLGSKHTKLKSIKSHAKIVWRDSFLEPENIRV